MGSESTNKEFLNKYSFGSTSAIITNLAIIIGLNATTKNRMDIIGTLIVIAVADNISDALGIHIFQESQGLPSSIIWVSTFSNFFIRFLTSLGFLLIMFLLPLNIALIISLIYGLLILSIVSYTIAKARNKNPWTAIVEHIIIAVVVIFVSKYFGSMIRDKFRRY